MGSLMGGTIRGHNVGRNPMKLSSELSKDAIRVPGAIPFVWEQTPGKPKRTTNYSTHDMSTGTVPNQTKHPASSNADGDGDGDDVFYSDDEDETNYTATMVVTEPLTYYRRHHNHPHLEEEDEEGEDNDDDDGDGDDGDAHDERERREEREEEKVVLRQGGGEEGRELIMRRFLPAAQALTISDSPSPQVNHNHDYHTNNNPNHNPNYNPKGTTNHDANSDNKYGDNKHGDDQKHGGDQKLGDKHLGNLIRPSNMRVGIGIEAEGYHHHRPSAVTCGSSSPPYSPGALNYCPDGSGVNENNCPVLVPLKLCGLLPPSLQNALVQLNRWFGFRTLRRRFRRHHRRHRQMTSSKKKTLKKTLKMNELYSSDLPPSLMAAIDNTDPSATDDDDDDDDDEDTMVTRQIQAISQRRRAEYHAALDSSSRPQTPAYVVRGGTPNNNSTILRFSSKDRPFETPRSNSTGNCWIINKAFEGQFDTISQASTITPNKTNSNIRGNYMPNSLRRVVVLDSPGEGGGKSFNSSLEERYHKLQLRKMESSCNPRAISTHDDSTDVRGWPLGISSPATFSPLKDSFNQLNSNVALPPPLPKSPSDSWLWKAIPSRPSNPSPLSLYMSPCCRHQLHYPPPPLAPSLNGASKQGYSSSS